MKKSVGRILRALDSPPHDYKASTAAFLELDLARLRANMALERKGRERGARNEPPPDATVLDDVEQGVDTFIEGERKRAFDAYLDNMRTYAERLRALDMRGSAWEIEVGVREAVSDFRKETHQGIDELFAARRRLREVEEEHDRFRAEHGLARTAAYPGSRVLHVGILASLFLFETVANGTLLSRGNEFGLLGGVLDAFFIAFLNIGVGWSIGRAGLPNLWHRSHPRKFLGALCLLLFLVFALAFNLAVAHYRDALGAAVPAEAIKLVMPRLASDPLALEEFMSWVLAGIGFLFSCAALADGLRMDDPYPGYGRTDRKRVAAVEEYVALKDDLLGDLEERKEGAAGEMRRARDDVAKRQQENHAVAEARKRMRHAFAAHLDYLETCANDLLSAYRDANRRARSEPPPAHFAERWRLSRPEDPHAGDQPVDTAAVDAEAARAYDILREGLESLFREYDEAVRRYQQVEAIVTREGKARTRTDDGGGRDGAQETA